MGQRITVDADSIAALGRVLTDLSEWIALRADLAQNRGQVMLEAQPGTDAYRRLLGDWERARDTLCTTLTALGDASTVAGAAYVTAERHAESVLTPGRR